MSYSCTEMFGDVAWIALPACFAGRFYMDCTDSTV